MGWVPLSKTVLHRNKKSEHIPNLENVVRIFLVWSECRDSNSGPLEPHSSAIPNFATPGYFVLHSQVPIYHSTASDKMQALFLKNQKTAPQYKKRAHKTIRKTALEAY